MKAYDELLNGKAAFRAPVLMQDFGGPRPSGDIPRPTATSSRRGGHA